MEAIDGAIRSGWASVADPAELFIQLWRTVGQWSPADRAILPRTLLADRHKLETAVLNGDGAEAVAAVLAVMNDCWPVGSSIEDRKFAGGIVIDAMHAIEMAFTQLHPRTRFCSPVTAPTADLPTWLEKAEFRRLRTGSFAEAEGVRLIPSGPFSRHARGRDAAAANSLQDHFPYLTVAPTSAQEGDRTIEITIKVIGTDVMRGVPAATSIGCERVRFVPLAEGRDDLCFTPSRRAEQPVIDVAPTIDMGARLLAAIDRCADIDIAFAPELTVPSDCEAEIGAGIAKLAELAPRIILAGTGLSVDKDEEGRPWNEARIFGRGGHLLWHQRKIWPYGMPQTLALKFGLEDPGEHNLLMEDIAACSTVTMVDLDGFGRCVVLICQDIQARPVVDQIVARYQPDWILTPILDAGVKIPGWAHTRAMELGRTSQSRVMVASSVTMSHLDTAAPAEPAIGLAVGPADPLPDLTGNPVPSRAVALVRAVSGSAPRSGLLVWDYAPPVWQQSITGTI